MTPKRKPLSALARLTASHMRLLKVQRGLIEEMGHLRRLMLEERRYKALYHAAVNPSDALNDGFGNVWEKCLCPDCALEIVRPGKVQCGRCGLGAERPTRSPPKEFDVPPYDWPRL